MSRLAALQQAVQAAVLEGEAGTAGDPPGVADLIEGHGLDPAQRLAIHRNATLISLTEALSATFPVVAALGGERFFAQAARAFVRRSPPGMPVLSCYGDGFPDFLAACEQARDLPWLADVARLEWARQGALHAAEVPPVPVETLSRVPPHLFPMARCAVHPAFRFVVSAWPVDRIWAMHQPDWPVGETVSRDEGGATVLVGRPQSSVRMARADQGTLALLFALDMGQTLQTAAEAAGRAAAAAADGRFDLTAALGRVLSLGLLTEVSVPQGRPCDDAMPAGAPDPAAHPISHPERPSP